MSEHWENVACATVFDAARLEEQVTQLEQVLDAMEAGV